MPELSHEEAEPGGDLLLSSLPADGDEVFALVRGRYLQGGIPVGEVELRRLLGGHPRGLRAAPPFAVAGRAAGDGLVALVDDLGLRQVYWTEACGWAAFSTSPRVLSVLRGDGLDAVGLALMATLGYPLRRGTLFSRVSQLGPGDLIRVHAGKAELTVGSPGWASVGDCVALPLDERILRTAQLLRTLMERYLDEREDLVLELSGGLDSRALLAAIPHGRRRGLKVVTIRETGALDTEVAHRLSVEYHLDQRAVDLASLDSLSPSDVGDRLVEAVRRFECSAEPLGHVVLDYLEAQLPQGARVHGVGGEVGRGFYYALQPRWGGITRQRVDRLAGWRLLPNSMMDVGIFEPDIAKTAPLVARRLLFETFREYDMPWLEATDEFYLRERMGRWAGNAYSTPSLDRHLISPLFDPGVIALSHSCPPADKRANRFMAGVVAHLDPALAAIPLAGGPPPAEMARPSMAGGLHQSGKLVHQSMAKARQRMRRGERPTVGAAALVPRVIQAWRDEPARLDGLRSLGIVRESWIHRDLLNPAAVPPSVATIGMCAVLNEAGTLRRLG